MLDFLSIQLHFSTVGNILNISVRVFFANLILCP
jgi:hypothetical protein